MYVGQVESEFSVNPSTQIVIQGENAVFYCRHPRTNIIGWFINNASLSSYTTSDFISRANDPDHTLEITSHLLYNGSTIECSAIFFDGRPGQTSPPAKLFIQGTLIHIIIIVL